MNWKIEEMSVRGQNVIQALFKVSDGTSQHTDIAVLSHQGDVEQLSQEQVVLMVKDLLTAQGVEQYEALVQQKTNAAGSQVVQLPWNN
jgi:hypothetical protein